MEKIRCDNILVRGVNWIGDAVMTMPALRSLRLANPGSRITLLVKPWVSPIFEKDPCVDEIILYSDEYKGISGRLRLGRELKRRGFCLAVLFQNALDAALISFLAAIPERVGYNRDSRRLLLTRPVPFDLSAKGLHHIDYYLNLISKAGFEAKRSLPWIYLSLDERTSARERLSTLKRPVVGINPGAAYGSSKRWRPESFASVANMVIGELAGSVVIFGGPSEVDISEDILRSVTELRGSLPEASRLLSVAGKTGLRELSGLISECDLLLTNDSGPMHIGYAVGTPVTAIFGSTSPELTGPSGRGDVAINKTLDCAPCFERTCSRGDLRCMDLIKPEEVFEAVRGQLGTKRAVFFDRDGTLCRDVHYLSRMEDLEVFPEVSGLRSLKDRGFSLIGITNQSGIARGYFDDSFVSKVNRIFVDEYGFDGFYYCPHHPDEHCPCRKPEPGLLVQARADHAIDLKRSFVVGDRESDMLLARAVGATGIFVESGKEEVSRFADFSARDLRGVVDIICGTGNDG